MQIRLAKYHNFIFWFVLGLILLGDLSWRWQQLNRLAWNNDEGIHLNVAYLALAGYQPYSEVSFAQMPLFLETVRWPLQTFGTVTAVRWAISLFGLLQLGGVALLARSWHSNIAGLAAAFTLATMPSFLYYSRAVMADVPAVALSIWAIWTAYQFYQTKQRGWLIVSGLLMGLSLGFKFLTIYAVGWIGLLLLYQAWKVANKPAWTLVTTNLLQHGLYFGFSLLVALALTLIGYDFFAFSTAVFGMRGSMREVFDGSLLEHLEMLAEFWQFHTPFILLGLYGLITMVRQTAVKLFLWTWAGLIMMTLLNHTPLHRQHLQLLPPLIAVLAGIGVAGLVTAIQPPRQWVKAMGGLVLAGWVLGYALVAPDQESPFTKIVSSPTEDEAALLDYAQRFIAPNDCLVTDDMVFSVASHRLPPPKLADISSARLKSGDLTYQSLVEQTQSNQCQMIVPTGKRLKRSQPDFIQWAAENFLGVWIHQNETEIFVGQPLTSAYPGNPLQITFSDQTDLMGFDLTSARNNKDQAVYLSLYWQPHRAFTADYTIFVHVRDAANNTVINADHLPYDGQVPTSRWPVGAIIKESIRLDIPDELPAGTYPIYVGMYLYDGTDFIHLPVQNDQSGENAVIVGALNIP